MAAPAVIESLRPLLRDLVIGATQQDAALGFGKSEADSAGVQLWLNKVVKYDVAAINPEALQVRAASPPRSP